MGYYLTVMKSFVSVLIEVDMLTDTSVQIKDPKWGDYYIQVLNIDTEDETFQVCKNGIEVNVEWATVEGATACAELLAEGYLKEW